MSNAQNQAGIAKIFSRKAELGGDNYRLCLRVE